VQGLGGNVSTLLYYAGSSDHDYEGNSGVNHESGDSTASDGDMVVLVIAVLIIPWL